MPDTDDATASLIAQADALLKKAQEHLARTEQVLADRGLTRDQAMALIESKLTPAERAELRTFVEADERDLERKRSDALAQVRQQASPSHSVRPTRKFRPMV